MKKMTEMFDDTAWYFKGSVDYVDSWFLMSTPWPVVAIWLSYITFVLKWGPEFMSKRPAFQLKNTLVLYNLFQVVMSCYIFYMGIDHIYNHGLVNPKCAIETKDTQDYIAHSSLVNKQRTLYGLRMNGGNGGIFMTFSHLEVLRGVYIYFLAKLSELLDTVFFVLRKKMKQVSFLHVYHHSLMMLCAWLGLKYNPTDTYIFLGTINSLVHVVMYAYYGLSLYPGLEKYLWWKKYITAFQLIQFALITLQVAVGTFVSNCNTSYVLLFTIFFNLGLMMYLFRDFYIKSYVKEESKGKINMEYSKPAMNYVNNNYDKSCRSVSTEKKNKMM